LKAKVVANIKTALKNYCIYLALQGVPVECDGPAEIQRTNLMRNSMAHLTWIDSSIFLGANAIDGEKLNCGNSQSWKT
jgi:hypothetical protein